jgi:hypothetical protein
MVMNASINNIHRVFQTGVHSRRVRVHPFDSSSLLQTILLPKFTGLVLRTVRIDSPNISV